MLTKLQLRDDLIVDKSVRKSLHELMVSLPRIVRSSMEGEKLTKLKLFAGYCQYLASSLHLMIVVSQEMSEEEEEKEHKKVF